LKSNTSAAPGTVERAFELAQSGACKTVGDVIVKLKQERHDSVEAHLAGPSIRRALRELCARSAGDAQDEPESKSQSGS
jgi:hypothetical protein